MDRAFSHSPTRVCGYAQNLLSVPAARNPPWWESCSLAQKQPYDTYALAHVRTYGCVCCRCTWPVSPMPCVAAVPCFLPAWWMCVRVCVCVVKGGKVVSKPPSISCQLFVWVIFSYSLPRGVFCRERERLLLGSPKQRRASRSVGCAYFRAAVSRISLGVWAVCVLPQPKSGGGEPVPKELSFCSFRGRLASTSALYLVVSLARPLARSLSLLCALAHSVAAARRPCLLFSPLSHRVSRAFARSCVLQLAFAIGIHAPASLPSCCRGGRPRWTGG